MSFILKVDVQHCNLAFESWSTPLGKMKLHWNKTLNWINPKIDTTLNKHTVNFEFLENEPTLYGDGWCILKKVSNCTISKQK